MTVLRAWDRDLRRFLPGRLVQALVAFFLGVGIMLVLMDRSVFADWFFPGLTGLGALAYAVSIVAFGAIFRERPRMSASRAAKHRNARRRFQAIAGGGMALCLLGTLGLYRLHFVGFEYDKALHFIVPALGAHGLARFLRRHDRRTAVAAAGRAASILAVMAVAWEAAEYASDRLLGTSAFGQGGDMPALDTALDLVLDGAGIALGAISATWSRERI